MWKQVKRVYYRMLLALFYLGRALVWLAYVLLVLMMLGLVLIVLGYDPAAIEQAIYLGVAVSFASGWIGIMLQFLIPDLLPPWNQQK